MKVHLAVAVSWERDRTPLPAFEQIASQDRFQVHALTDDPDEADLILFLDAHLYPDDWQVQNIRNHPLIARYPDKTCIYDERDRTWCSLPGIYVSMPHSTFNPQRQRACAYYTNNMTERLRSADQIVPDLLFSFMGSKSHKIRERIVRLSHPRAKIADTSHVNFFGQSNSSGHDEIVEKQKRLFATTLLRSKFVLCPRGVGTSSIRLYETMAAGRVPVIISDDWQRPSGPDWSSCAVSIREADIGKIPTILEARESEFETMRTQVRAAYARWFAPDVMYHHLIESCQEVLQNTPQARVKFDRQYLKCGLDDALVRGRMKLVRLRNQLLRGGS